MLSHWTEGGDPEDDVSTIEMVFDDSFFFRIPYHLMKHMKAAELILLSYLINWAVMKAKTPEGRFFCRMERIIEDLHIGRGVQSNLMKSLKEKGYINFKMEGMPPKRWITINWQIIGSQCKTLYREAAVKRVERWNKKKNSQAKRNGHSDEDLDL